MSDNALPAADQAARMNAIYRFQRPIYDLTRKYYLLGRDRMIRELDAGPGLSVLEVGCGTGRNLVAAARRWPGARFAGLDISTEMLRTARTAIDRRGLAERIELFAADAQSFAAEHPQLAERRFDRVFLSYSLSMIPGWERTIEQAVQALAPGGTLHIVDFGQQERLPRWFRSALFAWLHAFHVTPRAALHHAVETAAARHGRRALFRPLYRGYAWHAAIL